MTASQHALKQHMTARDRLGAWQRRIVGARGFFRWALAFLAGAVSVLALAPFFAWPVLFLTLPVLVWLIDGSGGPDQRDGGLWRAASAGWWFGFGYFLAGLFWIGEAFLVEADKFAWALPIAVTMLPAGLALFMALATVCARLVWSGGVARVLVLAVALGGTEWLRGHILTGFPWNVLGYALTWPLELMQGAALLGIYGLTLWTVLICAAPLVMAMDRPFNTRLRGFLGGAAWALVPLVALAVYGAARLAANPTQMHDGPRLRIVQPSIPQRDKWQAEKQGDIFATHLALSRVNAEGVPDGLAGITHVIWPEAAMPFLPLEHEEALQEIRNLLPTHTYLLAGALRRETAPASVGDSPSPESSRVFNSLLVFGEGGRLHAIYDKIHLVPFGEYLPFQAFLESIGLEQLTRVRGGFATGPEPRPLLAMPGLPPLGVLICYEAIFPDEIVQGSDRPGLLLNITNDGWFGRTTGPYQHFHQTRVRAVEEGIPIVRAANNGISAVIDGYGRVLQSLSLDEKGVIDSTLPQPAAKSPYSPYRALTFVLTIIAFMLTARLQTLRQQDNKAA